MKNLIRANRAGLWQNLSKKMVSENNLRKFSRSIMPRFHLIFGILVFVVFLITGKFMRVDFPDKEIIPQEFRLLMRSRHIYILFSSLIHICLGLYLQIHPQIRRKTLQISGSVLLITGSVLLVWAFAHETYFVRDFSDLSRFGLYATLAGTGLHLIGGFKVEKVKK